MPLLKRKPKQAKLIAPPRWHDRARAAINAHPKISWGTLAAIATILGVLVPWIVSWEARYQRVEQAKSEAAAIRAEMATHEKVDRRTEAWQSVGVARVEAIILRNRVNDCNIARTSPKALTELERLACDQYDEELKQGQTRYETAVRDAKALSQ